MNNYEEKTRRLKEQIEMLTKQDIIVAFSGGVDSSLILKLACDGARKNGHIVYAVTVQTDLHPSDDPEHARRVAEELGASHEIMEVDELNDAGIRNNPVDRCYRCKKHLFGQMMEQAQRKGITVILEGTNADDLKEYRPGIQAVQELGIISPLTEAGFTKAEVRRLAENLGVSTFRRPAAPCLATRFPYGTVLTAAKIKNVETGEAYIRSLGIYNVRLRIHGNVARIEVDGQDMEKLFANKTEIIHYLKNRGYDYITMDLEGFRSGSMDLPGQIEKE